MRVGKRLAAAMTAGLLMLLCGCSGFFPPLTSSGGGGSTTTGNFVYVANVATQTIAGFNVQTSTAGVASLTAVTSSPYAAPVVPTALAITPSNSYLYVAGIGGIYAYSINSTTGVLTLANSGGAVAIMTYPAASIDISPDGQWLFALSQDGATIQEYQITSSTGALAVQQPATYSITTGAVVLPKMVRITPNGAYVIAALGTAGDVVFPFTTSTGVFSTTYQKLATATNTSDNALAVDKTSGFLYIARSGTSTGVGAYTLGTGGQLSSIAGSPFAAGGGPFSVILDSTSKYVYVGNRTDGTISGYTVGTSGSLTAIANSPYATGTSVNSLARDSSGDYILATAGGGSPDLSMYSFDATTAGALDSAATVATGTASTQQALMVVATH